MGRLCVLSLFLLLGVACILPGGRRPPPPNAPPEDEPMPCNFATRTVTIDEIPEDQKAGEFVALAGTRTASATWYDGSVTDLSVSVAFDTQNVRHTDLTVAPGNEYMLEENPDFCSDDWHFTATMHVETADGHLVLDYEYEIQLVQEVPDYRYLVGTGMGAPRDWPSSKPLPPDSEEGTNVNLTVRWDEATMEGGLDVMLTTWDTGTGETDRIEVLSF